MYSLNPKKAPGSDNTDVTILRNVYNTSKALMSDWAAKCFSLGHFPEPLKVGQVVYFLKSKKDQAVPTSYRPICLLPTLGKLLEKIATKRLMYHLEKHNLLSKAQHGFRENRSCDTALNELRKATAQNYERGLYTNATAINITGAFDSVRWTDIIHCLITAKCPSQLTNLIASYLENRSILLKWYENEREHRFAMGCPQGSCLGPILWLVIAERIIRGLNSQEVKLIVYADDFLLLTKGRHGRELEHKAQPQLDQLAILLRNNGISASAGKT